MAEQLPGVVNRVSLRTRVEAFMNPRPKVEAFDRPFPAGDPLPPSMPHGAPARAHVPPPFANLVTRPRVTPGVPLTPFEQLRALADFDLVQLALQDCRGQILGMEWTIAPRAEFSDKADAMQGEIDAARQFVEMPDPLARMDFGTWIGSVVDEIYTTDALTLMPRRAINGSPLGLWQVDGATIVPLVTSEGRMPAPPIAAYQQIVHGIPETEFTADEMWYLPRNKRPNTPYGRSNVEQVIWTVNLAMRRYLDDLSYYQHGNLPDALYRVPATWSAQQIKEFQADFDDVLSGRSDRRSGSARFVPGGPDSGLIETRTRQWVPEFNEWLARVICWAFQVSPLPLVRLMNRGTAETSEESGLEGGVWPIAQFIARILNRYIRTELGLTRVEFCWQTEEVEDAAVVYQRNMAYVHGGALTFNELRAAIGEDPFDGEWAKRPVLINAASGAVTFLDTIEEDQAASAEIDAMMARLPASAPSTIPGTPADRRPVPERADDGDDSQPDGYEAALAGYYSDIRADLLKWRKVALRHAKEGKPQRRFESTAIPPELRARIEKALGLEPGS